MPRAPRDSNLQSRESRLKLKARKQPYLKRVVPGLFLGYRKSIKGDSGSWVVKQLLKGQKKYIEKSFAQADDYIESDGKEILSFKEAFTKAQDIVSNSNNRENDTSFYTVEQCLSDYWEWYKTGKEENRVSQHRSKIEIIRNSIPFRSKLISELNSLEIEKWHHSLVKQVPKRGEGRNGKVVNKNIPDKNSPDYPNYLRKRKTTANGYLSVLKSALNRAWRIGIVANNTTWARVRPFGNVNEAKIRFLSIDEANRLLSACSPSFRNLVEAALCTGARFGELTKLKVNDFIPDSKFIKIPATITKNGKSRSIPLNDQGLNLFYRITHNRKSNETIFLKSNGKPWVRSEQNPHMRRACKLAKIEPAIGFHILRHTYASQLTHFGAPLQVVSAVLGHSDGRLTEKHYSHLSPSFISDSVRDSLPNFGVDNKNVIPFKRVKNG